MPNMNVFEATTDTEDAASAMAQLLQGAVAQMPATMQPVSVPAPVGADTNVAVPRFDALTDSTDVVSFVPAPVKALPQFVPASVQPVGSVPPNISQEQAEQLAANVAAVLNQSAAQPTGMQLPPGMQSTDPNAPNYVHNPETHEWECEKGCGFRCADFDFMVAHETTCCGVCPPDPVAAINDEAALASATAAAAAAMTAAAPPSSMPMPVFQTFQQTTTVTEDVASAMAQLGAMAQMPPATMSIPVSSAPAVDVLMSGGQSGADSTDMGIFVPVIKSAAPPPMVTSSVPASMPMSGEQLSANVAAVLGNQPGQSDMMNIGGIISEHAEPEAKRARLE